MSGCQCKRVANKVYSEKLVSMQRILNGWADIDSLATESARDPPIVKPIKRCRLGHKPCDLLSEQQPYGGDQN